jgi:hypothetical protein
MKDTDINDLVNEFKKFIAILVINDHNGTKIERVIDLVDEVWHASFYSQTNTKNSVIILLVGTFIMNPM